MGLLSQTRLKPILLAIACAWFLADAADCRAGSWIFRRSYYSHQAESAVRVGRHASTRRHYTRPQGGYIRGGYRHLRVGGNLRFDDDHHHFFESWFQHGEQF